MSELIAGVDEVGRGPLAGAVVAAAVILDPNNPIQSLTDSKKLTERQRQRLAIEIREKSISWALGRAEVEEIDEINILWASMLAMKRAVEALKVVPTFVKIDGNRCPDLNFPMEAIVKGDLIVPEISAASIIAKVARDQEMLEMDGRYPGYGFAKHKGYPTKQHQEALVELGVSAIHRLSFRPVQRLIRN